MTAFQRWAFGLTVPACLIVTALYLVPLGTVLAISVEEPVPGLGNYAGLLDSPAVARVLATTLQVTLLTCALTLVASYVVAFALVHMSGRLRQAALLMVLVPFWISVLVRAFAWMTILRRQGVINSTLAALGLITDPLELANNRIGVVIGMVHYMMPFAILLLYANLAGIDRRIMQAARSLGARPGTVLLRLWLPLSLPGIAVAAIFVFVFSLGFLITPALLGGGRTVMIAEYISVQITNTLRWGVATSLATLLLVVVGAAIFLAMRSPALRAAFEGQVRQ
ncbi:ABC transporter permease [Labrys wisconsinensis]|uniref:Spermidine/putrescine transport system permease protein n=1 Tax=Labrys wisconsinensis TaxID=425677 RepID=A0ABU0JCI5_9HYPH|nr:ABC transporter permease [Labrys wisconsinensis]MDQ0471994.1 putative spermidine/putrescine transport system permease protein [Labrys wisconsinensis]